MAEDENKDEAVLDEEQKPDQTPEVSTEEVNEEADQSPDEGADKTESEEADKSETPEEDQTTISHRLEKRIEKQLSKLMGSTPTPEEPERPPEAYKPLNYAEQEEFDRQALEADRTKYGEAQRQQGESQAVRQARTEREQVRFLDKLETDRERVEIAHPELDPESDSFDPTLTDALSKMYIQTVGVDKNGLVRNPNVRYRDYVETFLAVADKIASKSSEQTVKNVTAQASRGAVRPQGQRPRPASIDFSNLDKMDSASWEKNKEAYYASVNKRLGIT